MRIACPTCAAAYEVPDALLAARPRLMRCARCGTQFAGAPAGPEPPPAGSAPAAPPPAGSAAAESATSEPVPPEASPPPAEAALPEPPPAQAQPAATRPPDPPPDPPHDVPPPTLGPAGALPTEPAESPAVPTQGRLAAAWLGSFAVLGAGVLAMLHWHAAIAAAWPPAARLFAVLGLG